MPTVLLIEDEIIYHRMLEHALRPLGFIVYTELTGTEGLEAAQVVHPDIVITDINLPDISGYEVTRRLRRDPRFAHVPIIILTSQTTLQDKLASFEAGADDHINKPFEPEELIARMRVLLKRAELLRQALPAGPTPAPVRQARMLAIHTLRGGIGASILAVNLAIGLRELWNAPTLLMDLAMLAGQDALLLNLPLRRTWGDLANVAPQELDFELLQSIIVSHESGLDLIAAPTTPTQAEMISGETLTAALEILRPQYDYIIADLPHDFNDVTLQILDMADIIVMLVAPELSSIRAAAAALDTYTKLNYEKDKIKIVLNYTFPRYALPRDKIETALGHPITLVLPYVPDLLVQSVNLGKPILYHQPGERFSELVEDFAFYLSTPSHKKTQPATPSPAWKRVYNRFLKARKSAERAR
ncbi:hypothetical protein SE15_03855 [Thermanaerothrix daxensis]|uniref:Response regulatory domain-containing protein n=1 Tax=Thermanaerothrix daxensis TaxID=869279 RepID=A0A0P6YNE2_9CHLR|nr:response regulator [Thermanaerothrix daxensis]KPL84281.1 hypothetical protein SE15_03855 [Thermanaerothrix daxensis]